MHSFPLSLLLRCAAQRRVAHSKGYGANEQPTRNKIHLVNDEKTTMLRRSFSDATRDQFGTFNWFCY